ncbi:uncharacterized protein LACBIDRAFT_331986 [Laccaria bicolor S238N-H82]|uniref:Predicted protein n=1 Tax=Laccaria bicolor (strain S238N-H82 / ATCC MYA-4686) TaxID=486041 RepID=B0DQX6_LACBS|nr:uncharacterized protein LACBIDRAFT_331986 [Laccaria bicolor S238N-H82]EDR03019.1 predicted protein [Laccaria bicolor S238N-H82]|eukprot:XP_001886442.1 predicted protein [Laccaria bicolor S238N-H82]
MSNTDQSNIIQVNWKKVSEHQKYNSKVEILRRLNLTTSGYRNMMKPGCPRQCYMPMPPFPGRLILLDGVYPVDYDDLCNLSEERANIIMDCFDLNGEGNEYANANIRVKIFEIAGFMGVSMKEKFREEYDRWEEEMEQDVITIE